jgi:hypothetical protein
MKHGGSGSSSGGATAIEEILISCDSYRRNDDGSWTALRFNTINIPLGEVRVNPGMIFKKGYKTWGVDIAAELEKNYSGERHESAGQAKN